ncbi:hypothetical protein IW262DRAFT_1280839, partial [Armillaria fumosa]
DENQTDESMDIAYTDRSTLLNRMADARAGVGVWYGNDDNRNLAAHVKGDNQTNNVGELQVMFERAMTAKLTQVMKKILDSEYMMDGLCFYLKHWEDRGWIGIPNRKLWKVMAARLRQQGAEVLFQWTKGHSGDPGNEGTDALALEGAMKDVKDTPDPDLSIDIKFEVSGTWLSKMTQSLAYKGIRALQLLKEHPSVLHHLD